MDKGLTTIFEYETPKVVTINNIRVGIIHRVLQLLILIYCICWAMIYEKGYQTTETITSSVTTKVKGMGVNEEIHRNGTMIMPKRAWDVADYVIPALENNALFVLTNAVLTPKQKQTTCSEADDSNHHPCEKDSDCPTDRISQSKNGIHTGRCLKTTKSCEIMAWCPLEDDSQSKEKGYLFPDIVNYTVLIKNNIEFKKFKVRRRNIQPWASKTFLNSCSYDKNHPEYKYCPIFKFSSLFEESEVSVDLFQKGGVIGIFINWECNLDWDQRYCNPGYSFQRLDLNTSNIANGFNFRYANYYRENNTEYRDLMKAIGIRFLIFVEGKAGRFHFLPLTMNVGSSLALLGIAPILCDMIVLNMLGSRHIYQSAKFESVNEPSRRGRSRNHSSSGGPVNRKTLYHGQIIPIEPISSASDTDHHQNRKITIPTLSANQS